MPIKIDFLANVRDFIRGTKNVEESLDDVADSLDDVARDGDRATEKLEDSFRDLSRRARDTTRDVDDLGDKGKTSFRKLGDTGEEVSGELKQNLGETFSSFRGDLEDLPQIAQDVLGGLAGSFGGLATSIGLAAGAAGIGLLIAAFQTLAEQEEARKERVGEWAGRYIEAAGQIKGALASLAAVEDIYTDQEKYDKAAQAAKDWGVDVSVAVNAMAGDATALEIAQQSLADRTDKLNKALETTVVNADGTTQGFADIQAEVSRGADTMSALTGEMEEGQARAESYAESLGQLAVSTGVATGKVDDLGNKIYALPDGTEVVVDAVTGKAYQNLDAVENKAKQVDGTKATLRVEAWDNASAQVDRIIQRNNGKRIRIDAFVRQGGKDYTG